MTKTLLQICFLLFLSATVLAQNRQITGQVTDQGSNDPVIGASVIIKGTSRGTQTDVNGRFKLSVPDGAVTLVVRYVGYKSQEVTVGASQSSVNLKLASDATQLNEVVVVNIGYGTVSKNALTGSVSSVSAKQLKDIPINSTSEALQGRLAGVQITQSEGSPDAAAVIKVRGGGSITQDNSPLYVVDGVQVENALSVLAPQDIQSIDVLKDAASTAIYGARGANGVVIITTKGGFVQKPTVTYNGLVGFRKLARKLDVMNAYDFVQYQYERAILNGSTALASFQKQYGDYNDLALYQQYPAVDWQDQMFGRNAFMQTHNLSLVGGTKDTKYNLSITDNGEQGIQRNSDFDRKVLNFRLDQNITDKLSVNFTTRYNNTIVNGAGTSDPGSSATNRLRQAVRYKPILGADNDLTAYDPDYAAETNGNSLSLVNPILLNQQEYRRNYNNTLNLSGSVNYNITKLLSIKSTVGYDYYNSRQNAFNDTLTSVARQNFNLPTASINTVTRGTLDNSNVITFNMDKSGSNFSKKNSLNVLLGQEVYQNIDRAYRVEGRYFPYGIKAEEALNNFALAVPPSVTGATLSEPPPTSSQYTNRILSFFGRVNYAYDNKYLINATFRADGSSKFAEGHQWGKFPSASVAWRVSEEKFFGSLKNTINDLKIRASYGQAGNNRIGDFLFLTQFVPNANGNFLNYYSINDQLVATYIPQALAYNNLTWESTISRNLGFDISLLSNRLQLTADFYNNETKNLLVPVPLAQSSGYSEQLRNAGRTSNKGVEVQLNATPIASKNVNWSVNFNISYNENRVKSIGDYQTSRLYASGWAGSNQPSDFILKVGQPVGAIWGLVNDGYYTLNDFTYASGKYTLKTGVANNSGVTSVTPQPGVMKYKDLNGDGVVDDKDRTILGNAQPKFFGGLNQQIRWKNFDASVFVNFQLGNKVLNANKLEFTSGYTPDANLLSIMNGRWRNVNAQGQVVTDPVALAALNANATIWSPLTTASSFYVNSWSVEDGSFLRINNVTLGYTLPKSLMERLKVSSLRIYGTVNNVALFTHYTGYDPDVNTRRGTPVTPGVDYSAYPRSRAFILGVNLTL